jgi:cytochrome P450
MEFDWFDPEVVNSPHAICARLRREQPIFDNFGSIVLTRHADIVAALRDPRLGRRFAYSRVSNYGPDILHEPVIAGSCNWLINLDAPKHTPLRAVYAQAMKSLDREAVRHRVTVKAEGLLDTAMQRGSLDLVMEYAYPLALFTIFDFLGLEDDPRFSPQEQKGSRMLEPRLLSGFELKELNAHYLSILDYFRPHLRARRQNPRDDFLSRLLQATHDFLSEEELLDSLVFFFDAGYETTASLISASLLGLHPAQLSRLRENPALLPNTVREIMRFYPSIQIASRVAFEPVQLNDDWLVESGQQVVCLLFSGNRDEAIFTDPDEIQLDRDCTKSISFGGGSHFCLGSHLAQMETEIALTTILRRAPNFYVDPTTAEWKPNFTVRGLRRLIATC